MGINDATMKVFKHKPAPSVTPRSGVVVVDVGLVVCQVAVERGDNILVVDVWLVVHQVAIERGDYIT